MFAHMGIQTENRNLTKLGIITAVFLVGGFFLFASVSPVSGTSGPPDSGSAQIEIVQESGTITVDVRSGEGATDASVTVRQNGDYVDSKHTGADGTVSFDVAAGDYTVSAQGANEVSKDVTVTAGGSTPVTLTFATLEIDADSGYGAIETSSSVDDSSGEWLDSKTVPEDGVATYHLAPGTYEAKITEANAVTKNVSLTAGTTTPVTLTFATLEIDADSGYGAIETSSSVDDSSGEWMDSKTVPKNGAATYHLAPGTYEAEVIEANEVSKNVSLTAGVTTPVTLTFATLEIDADSGYGAIESSSSVDDSSGDWVDSKTVPEDGVATYHLDPGSYEAQVIEANEVSENVSLTAGTTTPVTLTFATLEIDADSGYGAIETSSSVDDRTGDWVDSKTVPQDGVATYHLAPGTYEAQVIEANEVTRNVSITAGTTKPVTLTFATLEVDTEVGNQQIESSSEVEDESGDWVDSLSVPKDGVATYHLDPGTYEAQVIEANEISREVSVRAGETRSELMSFARLKVNTTSGSAVANVDTIAGDYVDGKSIPADGYAEFRVEPGSYNLEVRDDDSDTSAAGSVTISDSERTIATAQFTSSEIDVQTEPLLAANFEFSGLTFSTTELPAGASISVSATVENTGDTPGTYTSNFTVDGEIIAMDSGSLGVDEQATITFSRVLDTPGEYNITIADLPVQTITVTGDDGTDENGSPSPLPGFNDPPTDPDSDGSYEDVNGDSRTTTGDVQALFANLDAASQDAAIYDYNGDGRVTTGDVQALFATL
jgi:hypothetical protein